MNYPKGIAFIDGQYVPMEDAKISILDWGFLRSDATYDVVHVWKGRFFRLDVHIARFVRSVEKLKMKLPVTPNELAEILSQCVQRSGLSDAYVEMVMTRGASPTFSRDPREAVNKLICFAIPFGWILRPELHEAGMSAIISDIRRISPDSVDPTVKNYHWLDLVMGLYEAFDRDAQTVFLTNADGNLAEGPGYNIFTIRDGQIATPESGVLRGVTRQSVIELAQQLAMPIAERPVSQEDAASADEIFATSTAGGIMPVTKLNGKPVGDGRMGPMTRQLLDAYWKAHEAGDWSVAVEDAGTQSYRIG